MATTIRFTDTELENAIDFAARRAVDQPDNRGISQSREEHKRNLRVGRLGKIAFAKYLQSRCNFTAREIRNKLMKKGSFLFLVWILLSLSLVAYAEPPIEVIYWKASDVQTPSQDDIDSIRDAMVEVQSFFASEMDRHGFGEKTFDFNRDIEMIEGKLKLRQYTSVQIHRETSFIEWGLQNQIYVVFLGGATGGVELGASAVSKPLCVLPADLKDCNSMIVVPANNDRLLEVLLAHEIAHSFSLFEHAPTRLIDNRIDIMYAPLHVIPGVKEHLKNYVLSHKDATFLNDNGRLSVQQDSQDSDQEIVIDTDVNDDGYTDLYDCLIVRSGMSIQSSYDTDINNDGVTNILDLMLVKAAAFEAIAAAAPPRRKVITTTWGELKRR